jgi:hypothetical protein
MMSYLYKAFGLNIKSEIQIPEFLPASDAEVDVIIHLGEVPGQLSGTTFKGVRFEASSGQFLLKVDAIADYYSENGQKIIIQPYNNAEEADIRLFLLGSVFGALLHQRGMLPMHGSSLAIKGKAYIFSGISGVGKSTLAAGLINRGYQLLSDDISVVSANTNNKPVIYPGYPALKLWADSLKKLGKDPEQFARVRSKLNKHHLQVADQFHSEKLPVGGVYILNTKNTEGHLLEEIKGIEKFNAQKNNTYRLNFIKGLGNTEAHFRNLSALATNCIVKRITRSTKTFSPDELLDIIENDINTFNGVCGS